jgi:DNA-binding transcriptional regulator YiaG
MPTSYEKLFSYVKRKSLTRTKKSAYRKLMNNELNIRKLRETLGESQAKFAERFSVTQTAVSLWERFGPPKRGLVRRELDRLWDRKKEAIK